MVVVVMMGDDDNGGENHHTPLSVLVYPHHTHQRCYWYQ